MSGPPLVSVLVPARNAERFVGQAIASALAQTHARLEVVVVDDGSTDATAEAVSAIADPRVRLFRSGGRGVSAARNLAAAESRGDLLAPLDADDLWRPEKLARQLAALAREPAASVALTWTDGIDEEGRVVLPGWGRPRAGGRVLEQAVVDGLGAVGSTPLVRRALFEAVGGYDEAFSRGEDQKLLIALAARTPFALVREPLVGYRLYDANSSRAVAAGLEQAEALTGWIRRAFPDLPERVLRARARTLMSYFAFWALRNGDYAEAVRLQLRALAARPAHILGRDWTGFWAMLVARAGGFPRYRWSAAPPPPFLADRPE